MKNILKYLFFPLLLLNIVVLAGQVYPEGAPPFAVTVNIIFLIANPIYLIIAFNNARKNG